MNELAAVPFPAVPSIDLSFRPASYFWPLPFQMHLLARVKGAERKSALQRLIADGRFDDIPEFLAQSALSDADRQAIGRIHPAFMGGEYLPDLAQDEVMIASITIAFTTRDVTCVYARRRRHRIHYRVVDEYEGDTLSSAITRTSIRPLTLGQLERFFNGAWSLLEVLEMNFADGGYRLEEMPRFVLSVDSAFYPQIGALWEHRIQAWAEARRAGIEEGERERENR